FAFAESARGGERRGERAEDAAAVRGAEKVFARALRVRHHAEHVARARADSGYRVARAVHVRLFREFSASLAVAEDDPVFAREFFKRLVVAHVVSLGVRNGEAQDLARAKARGERRLCRLDAHTDVAADEVQVAVAYQSAGQQSRLAQYLKAVADAEDEAATVGELPDRGHDGREARERARAQIIAVGEAAGDDDRVVSREVCVAVPDEVNGLTD